MLKIKIFLVPIWYQYVVYVSLQTRYQQLYVNCNACASQIPWYLSGSWHKLYYV
jgi:hypothetical protein